MHLTVSFERFYLRHMAFVRGCSREEAIKWLGTEGLLCAFLAHDVVIRNNKCYWSS
jgi:hypothetical protein